MVSLRGANPLLKNLSPFPLSRGRGIKGDKVILPRKLHGGEFIIKIPKLKKTLT